MATKLPNKDPDECLDYVFDFSELLPTGREIESATVEVESANPAESPITLVPMGSPFIFLLAEGSPQFFTQVSFWLDGGTLGTTYTIKVTAFDDSVAGPSSRCFVRRATVKIKEK